MSPQSLGFSQQCDSIKQCKNWHPREEWIHSLTIVFPTAIFRIYLSKHKNTKQIKAKSVQQLQWRAYTWTKPLHVSSHTDSPLMEMLSMNLSSLPFSLLPAAECPPFHYTGIKSSFQLFKPSDWQFSHRTVYCREAITLPHSPFPHHYLCFLTHRISC